MLYLRRRLFTGAYSGQPGGPSLTPMPPDNAQRRVVGGQLTAVGCAWKASVTWGLVPVPTMATLLGWGELVAWRVITYRLPAEPSRQAREQGGPG